MTNGATRLLQRLFAAVIALSFASAPAQALAATEPPSRTETRPADAPLLADGALHVPAPPPDFHKRNEGWLQLSYPPADEDKASHLTAAANEEKALLEKALGVPVLASLEFRLTRTPEEMAAQAPTELPPPAYASGVAYAGMHLILVTRTAPITFQATDIEETLRHELVHIALEDATLGKPVPRWFNEGFAVFESGEEAWSRRGVLWQSVVSGTVIPLDELDVHFPEDHTEVSIAYAESADFVRFLMRDPDKKRFESLIARVRTGTPFARALQDAYSADLRKLEYQWRQEISRRYGVLPFILTSGSAVWGLAIVLFGFGYIRKRREAQAKLRRWEREDAVEDAAIRSAHVAAELPRGAEEEPPMRSPEVPVVEHGGSWHTLH